MDIDFVAFSVCEAGRFRIILTVEDSSEKVVRQLWDKVLMSESARYPIETHMDEDLQGWIIHVLAIRPLVKPQVATAPLGD